MTAPAMFAIRAALAATMSAEPGRVAVLLS
jgi:hypothetical protein